MNGSYFKNPTFPTLDNVDEIEVNKEIKDFSNNLNKKVKVYASFPYLNDNKEQIFEGILEQFNNNYLIIRDIHKEVWYYVLYRYLNYIEFNEKFELI